MQEVLPLIVNHGLSSLGLNRIEGFVDSDNINCKRAMAKLDFTHEKTLVAAEQKAGRSIDVEVYVKTA
jgi:ribosomal-protein-alanine N-acetyltransferase